MFASLSSFLPSVLQINQGIQSPSDSSPPRSQSPPSVTVDPPPRKKERKDKHANEAFIVVRPPPSKSTHPLSLQVQLVPPQARHDKPVQALDTSDDTDLRRTHSNRSEASTCSGYTSTASVSSLASSSTAGSSRRMIIPLYNLNVHHVLPTTILDAGTDAKVAKFTKRGIEIVDLALLEPIEVRTSIPLPGAISVPGSARTSIDDSASEFGTTSRSLAISPSRRETTSDQPTTSHSTINSADDSRKATLNLTIVPPESPSLSPLQPQKSAKKLFTKMFKKKDPSSQLSIAVPLPGIPTTHASPFRTAVPASSRHSNEASAPYIDTPHTGDILPSAVLPSAVLPSAPLTVTTASSNAVLGVYPTLYPPGVHPKCRPTRYVWVVKKWLKGTDVGLLNGMMGMLSANGRDNHAHSAPQIEVRFEWLRGQKKGRGRKLHPDRNSNPHENHSVTRHHNTTNNSHTTPRAATQTLSPDSNNHRSSIISQNSTGSDTATSMGSHPPAEDSEDESDPEDSETPWTCAVIVQRLVPSSAHQSGNRENSIRLKVATLSPTPHHPKVVGLLKMPFPLPDIEIEHLAVRRRVVTAQGITKTTSNTGEFVLAAEEIKDTISSTALWLVVREAFGGVGRERKKGKP